MKTSSKWNLFGTSLLLVAMAASAFGAPPASAGGPRDASASRQQIETPTELPTDAPTSTDTPASADTATSTDVPTEVPTPTDTPASPDTQTPTETPTDTPAPSDTPTATEAPTATPTAISDTSAFGDVILVTTTEDELNGDGDCSLREAIQAANTDVPVDACRAGNGADSLVLPPGIFALAIPGQIEDMNLTGDLDITAPLTIQGAGSSATIIDGGGLDRVFNFLFTDVSISDLTLRNGSVFASGGGIEKRGGTAVLTNVVVTDNTSYTSPGGIVNHGMLTIIHSTVSNNVALGTGGSGGIRSFGTLVVVDSIIRDNRITFGSGGGIAAAGSFSVPSSLRLEGTTVTGNSARNGGGLSVEGFSDATVTNSTISGNTAGSPTVSGVGGGIVNLGSFYQPATLTVTSSTITGNAAFGAGGGIHNASEGTTTLKNTILANNTSEDCVGTITSAGHNLIRETTRCVVNGDTSGNITDSDPVLGSLTLQGGPNETHALLDSSPAIDAGSSDCPPPSTDQRGEPRPVDGDGDGVARCDIGAFEAEEGTTTTPSANTYVVNTTDDADDGTCDGIHCSLREAINAANGHPGADRVVFNIAGDPPFTIQPRSALPEIAEALTIDGASQPGFGGFPIVELDGSLAGIAPSGLTITGSDSTIRGLAINRFGGGGIVIMGERATDNEVVGNFIGTDPTGTVALANHSYGVALRLGASDNVIGGTDRGAGNLISGNSGDGVGIIDPGTTSNTVQGNHIGTDLSGTLSLPNGRDGVSIANGASYNLVGGTDEGARNLISGNSLFGVGIFLPGTSGNTVQGNYIGTDVTGTLPLGNSAPGIAIGDDASGNLIGGTNPGAGNLISGNGFSGVAISDPGTADNLVQGNFIGTDATGLTALGNANNGVLLAGGASDNLIGGPEPGAGNVISGNGGEGIGISSLGTNGNVVQGNFIGTDVTGMNALGNSLRGVFIVEGPAANLIGGGEAGVGNLISGNGLSGVNITDGDDNIVQGNYIGTDRSGTAPIGNGGLGGGNGVVIDGGSVGNLIGGTNSRARNIISGNLGEGVGIFGEGTTGNVIQGNFIGTDVTGTRTASVAEPGAADFTVTALGETCPTYPPGTDFDGFISQSDDPLAPWSGTSVHFQGTDECSGQETLGEASLVYRYMLEFQEVTPLTSIAVSFAGFNGPDNALRVLDENMNVLGSVGTVGGNSFGTNFVMLDGIEGKVFFIDEFDTSSTWRFRESIVVNGPLPMGNRGSGVGIGGGATGNWIGGTEDGAGNLISDNMVGGVGIFNLGTTGNVVQGNVIGTDITGTLPLGNGFAGLAIGFAGVAIGDQAADNLVGGTQEGAGNLISGNASDGVVISGPGTTGNVIHGNLIGTDVTGMVALGNAGTGVGLGNGASNNVIGGTGAGARNVISSNEAAGIVLTGAGTSQNVVQGNLIGTSSDGTRALPNTPSGLWIDDGASNNTIGGTDPAAGNLMSGNASDGVVISGPGTTGNVIQGNYIGTDVSGTAALPNEGVGVWIGFGASNNAIGGAAVGEGNLISGNHVHGVSINSPETVGTLVQGNLVGTDATGTTPLPNLEGGVATSGSQTLVGGTELGSGNTIAHNGGFGVMVWSASGDGNAILGNSISSNAGLGIDLNEDGVTPNDPRDRDGGPNDLQNFPVLSPPVLFQGSIKVAGVLASQPNSTYRIEVFRVAACDDSGYGEGDMFLGFADVTTGPSGLAAFVFELPPDFPLDYFVTATATDSAGSTSEFSRCAGPVREVGGGR